MLGTRAAKMQSKMGNVSAKSSFASAQAVSQGAEVPTVVKVIGGAVTGVMVMIVTAVLSGSS
jgi:hypothetical protein